MHCFISNDENDEIWFAYVYALGCVTKLIKLKMA